MKLFIVLIILGTSGLQANALQEIGAKIALEQKELDRLTNRINEGIRRLQELKIQHKEVTERVRRDRQELDRLRKSVDVTEKELASSTEDIQNSNQKIKAIHARLQTFENSFYTRLRHVFMNRNQPWFKILLNAQNLADFDRRLHYYKLILEADSGHFDLLRSEYRALLEEQKKLKSSTQEADLLSKKLLTQREALLLRIREDTQTLQKIATEQDILEKQEAEFAKSSKYLEEKISHLISAQNQIRSDVKRSPENLSTPPGKKISRNSLLWPLAQSFTITKPFGNVGQRGATVFSPGIDMETQDQPVMAAEDGVIFYRGAPAGSNSSYGKVIMIAHGDYDGKFITLYGNLDNILVTLNQTIKRGDRIATVSSTQNFGNNSAAKLHFQVRVNGEPKNPIDWLQPKK